MERKKRIKKTKRWLCMFLAIILICGVAPGRLKLAAANETEQTTQEGAEESEEPTQQETKSSSEDPIAAEGAKSEPESNTNEEVSSVNENSIKGKIWLDTKSDYTKDIYPGNGIYDIGEVGVTGYTVNLFKASDLKNAVQTKVTDKNGLYEFSDLEPDTYVLGISADIVSGVEYLLPLYTLDGTEGNNRFITTYDEAADDYLFAYSAPLEVKADTVITDLDAGVREPVRIVPVAFNDYYNSDGLGHSAAVSSNPIGKEIKLIGYGTAQDDTQWPSELGGKTTRNNTYTGGVYDGDGGLWLIPGKGIGAVGKKKIYVVRVDTKTGEMQSFSNWPDGMQVDENFNFVGGVYDEQDGLWMIPYEAGPVVRVQTKTTGSATMGDMKAYNGWNTAVSPVDGSLSPFDKAGTKYAFQGGFYDGSGSIWLIPSSAESFVKINITNGQMTNYTSWAEGLDSGEMFYAGGVFDGEESIWLVPHNAKEVIQFNMNDGTVNTYADWPAGCSQTIDTPGGRYGFAGGINDGKGWMWMIPYNANMIVKVSINSLSGQPIGTMVPYDFPVNYIPDRQDDNPKNFFIGGVFDGQNIWMTPSYNQSIVRLDTADGSVEEYGTEAAPKRDQWTDLPGFTKVKEGFWGGAFDGMNVWMIPTAADRVVKIVPDHSVDVEVSSTEVGASAGDPIFYNENNGTDKALVKVTAKNKGDAPNNVIVGMDWFRTTTADAVSYDTKAKFEAQYAASTTANKSNVDYENPNTSKSEFTYTLKENGVAGVTKNGTYWIRVRFNNGSDYIIKKVTIDNIYTQSQLMRRGVEKGNVSNVIYPPEGILGKYGVALELDSQNVLNRTYYDPALVGYQYGSNAKITVDAKAVPGWAVDGAASRDIQIDKVNLGIVTFEYLGTSRIITEKYVDESGNPLVNNGTGVADTTQTITYGDSYNGDGEANTNTKDYICIGHYIAEGSGAIDLDDITYYPHTGNINPTITNVQKDYTVYFVYTTASIKIEKFGNNGSALKDVTFKLERIENGSAVGTPLTDVTDENGKIEFHKLPKGQYRLSETDAPSGYTPLKDPVDFNIPYHSSSASTTGSNYSITDSLGVTEHYFYNLTYKITNQATLEMPEAGNNWSNTSSLLMGIGILLAAAVVMVYRKKRLAANILN